MTKDELIKTILTWKLSDDKMKVLAVAIPELAESEDEKIREELIEYFEWNTQQILDNFDNKDVIAWLEKQGKNDMGISEATKQKLEDSLNKALEKETPESWNESLEKQGEQKPADKVEPKFKVGDWITDNTSTFQIVRVENEWYYADDGDKICFDVAHKYYRLWVIQDAKEGDVLCIYSSESDFDCVFLYQNTVEIESGRNVAVAYCGIDVYANRIEFGIQGPDCIDVRKIKPATKEQCDLLFSKMKEAGYEWDAEKKELKKIERKPTDKAEPKFKVGDVIRLKGGAAEYTIRRVTDTAYYTD